MGRCNKLILRLKAEVKTKVLRQVNRLIHTRGTKNREQEPVTGYKSTKQEVAKIYIYAQERVRRMGTDLRQLTKCSLVISSI